jgi:hypothetical protein
MRFHKQPRSFGRTATSLWAAATPSVPFAIMGETNKCDPRIRRGVQGYSCCRFPKAIVPKCQLD